MPKRIQLRRAKGWRKPAGCVSVGRGTRWGNPFKLDGTIDARYLRTKMASAQWRGIGSHTPGANEDAVCEFEDALNKGLLSFTIDDVKRELRGKDLACWCGAESPCHAQVLLAIANE